MLGSPIEYIVRYEGRYEELIEEAAHVALKNSRMFVAGNIGGFTGPFGHDFNGAAETTATRELVKRVDAIWEENTGPDLMFRVRKHPTMKRGHSDGMEQH